MGASSIRATVERQSGACRALAYALESYAESMGLFRRQEAKILLGFAESAASIADGLTEALHENTPGRLRAMWSWSLHVAVPFALGAAMTGGTEGYVSTLVGSWGDNPTVVECANAVVENAQRGVAEVEGWRGDPADAAEDNYPSPAAEYFGILLRRASYKLGSPDEMENAAGEKLGMWELGLREDPLGPRAMRIVEGLERLVDDNDLGESGRERVNLMRRVIEASIDSSFRLEDFPRRTPI